MPDSINPATNVLLRSYEHFSAEEIEARLARAADAFLAFRHTGLDLRILWMRRLAALLESDSEELAALITQEVGRTITSARAEITKCALCCRYYADNAAAILAPEVIATGHIRSVVHSGPLGPVLAIMPWNFPLWQVFRFLAPALMADNVALLKHADNVPQCALAIESLVRRAGFPRGVMQTLFIEVGQVESVIADPRVAAVTVTGSVAAGKDVAAKAGWHLKKTVLELGGCDPFLVLPGCNLEAAVSAAVASRILANGQSCIAAKRFLVDDSLYESFVDRFTRAMYDLRVGDPSHPEVEVGPLATSHVLTRLHDQVTAAVAAGGRVLTGGHHISSDGNFYAPTVIIDVPRDAPVAQEETFGPVALIFRTHSLDDSIALANATPFGLAGSAWTDDARTQKRLSAELDCGAVFFNAMVASDPRLPFGGIKQSGYGRELAAAGMREFLNLKTVVHGPLPTMEAPSCTEPEPVAVSEPTLEAPLPLRDQENEAPGSASVAARDRPATELTLEERLLGDWEPPPRRQPSGGRLTPVAGDDTVVPFLPRKPEPSGSI